MSLEYSRSALRISVAQICQNLGWNSIHSTPLELLTDILERYLFQLSKLSHRYAEQFGLTDPRLEDVGLALGHMGVSLHELEEYIKHVDPIEFAKEVVAFPVPRQNDLKFPNPESKEVQQRKVFEFVPEHLPYMHPELNEDTEDSNPPLATSPERLQVEQQPQTAELSPGQGEKRPISSPGDSNLPFKRIRLTTSHLPDEASHSQYEMTSVVMTNSGILSPMRQGKIPDSRIPPGSTQIVIVKSASSGAHKGPMGTAMPGVSLKPETPIITLDFKKDPVTGQSKIAEADGEIDSGAQVNLDKSDPEFQPKKRSKDKGKLPKPFKVKRGPGRPRSPGRAPLVIHKKSEMDVYKMLTLPRKDDSLGKTDTLDQQGPIDLTVKPTPAPPNISVKLDDSLKAKSVEHKQKNVTISKEQEQDMEETIASVIQKSAQFDIDTVDRSIYPLPLVHKDSNIHDRSDVKTEVGMKQEDVWRVSSISETFTDENALDSFDDDGRNMGLLSPSQHLFTAPHLRFLQQSPRRRGRPRGSSSSVYRGLTGRGRKPGRPPLNRSPGRGSPGRPPLNRSPGRPPLNRSPGRPPGSGRSPGRPKGSLNKVHSPKPRGRPRGSKSPRSRGSSPRGLSPRGAIQTINFDVNTLTESTKPCKEDSNDSEATNFEFPTQSPDSESGKKSFDLEETDKKNFDLTDELKSPKKSRSLPASPVHSPKKEMEISPTSRSTTTADLSVRKEVTQETKSAKIEPFSFKRDPSSDLSDRDMKEKLQDSEDDSSRKTTNYGELDSQSRNSEDRDSSSERMFTSKHKLLREKSPDRERRDSSVELDLRDSSIEREQRDKDKDRVYEKDKGNIMEEKVQIFKKESSREMSIGRESDEPTMSRSFKEHSRERDLKERSREREEREMSWDRESRELSKERDYTKLEREHKEHSKDRERREYSKERLHKEHSKDRGHKEHSKEREQKERSKDREHKEHSKDREHKEHSKDREHKEHSKDREHKEHSKDREHKEHSKEREHKEHSKDREHKEHSKDREHKEHSKDREHKEHSKDREHKEHRKDKDHKKDKKKKKKKDKEKDRDEKKEKKEKHKVKEKDSREESPSIQPLVQKLKIKFGGGSATSPGSFSVSASTTPASPVRESVSPVQRLEIPKLKFKVLPPKPDASSGLSKDNIGDVENQSWTSSVKHEIEKVPTPKHEPRDPSPVYSPAKVKSEPVDNIEAKEKDASDVDMNKSGDNETEKEVTVSVIKGKITGIGSAKKPGKRGKRKGSVKKGKPKTPKVISQLESCGLETKVLPLKKGLDKDSSESPSNLFSGENVPSPITIPALKAAPPPPSPPVTKKTPPKPKTLLKEKEMKPLSPLFKEDLPKVKPSPVIVPKPAKVSKSSRRSSPRKSPKISPTVKKKGAPVSTPTSKSPSPKPPSPPKSTPFDFTVPRTPSPSPLSTPSHSVHSSPMYSPNSSPSRDSLTFNIPPTPAFPTRTTSPPLSPPSRQLSTDDEKEATPPVEKPRMPPPALPPMPPTSAMRRQQRSVVAETIGSFVNESGEKIWICPACTMQDDGSPMIGCDICDDWYHWICVGIKEEPEEDVWYCPKCKPTKTQQKKRGRKKKK